MDSTPFRVASPLASTPRVARGAQPWAERWNAVGVRRAFMQINHVNSTKFPGNSNTISTNILHELRRAPKVLNHSAQGCAHRATLGALENRTNPERVSF